MFKKKSQPNPSKPTNLVPDTFRILFDPPLSVTYHYMTSDKTAPVDLPSFQFNLDYPINTQETVNAIIEAIQSGNFTLQVKYTSSSWESV